MLLDPLNHSSTLFVFFSNHSGHPSLHLLKSFNMTSPSTGARLIFCSSGARTIILFTNLPRQRSWLLTRKGKKRAGEPVFNVEKHQVPVPVRAHLMMSWHQHIDASTKNAHQCLNSSEIWGDLPRCWVLYSTSTDGEPADAMHRGPVQ